MVPFPGQNIRQRPDTVEQLRDDIDGGRTRDKVRGGDPAAAPLGADEEAAGTPIPVDAVAYARRAGRDHAGLSDARTRRERSSRRGWTVAALAALVAVAVLSVWMAA